MIRLEEVTTDCFDSVSFEIPAGSVCKLITDSDYEKRVLLNTILAVQRPAGGKVFLFGKDIYTASKKELLAILRNIGMVWSYGGLVSNLKVWENIALPVWYHRSIRPQDAEKRVLEIFGLMGEGASHLMDHMGSLPGPLPLHEKRMIGTVRAILMEPELMIYDSLFEGVSADMAEGALRLTTSFHSERPGRTSVYVSSDEDSLKDVKADTVIRQDERGFAVWE